MPRILKATGKHGDEFFDAADDEQLAKSALVLLEERLNDGWYDEMWEDQARAIVELRTHDEEDAGRKAWRFLTLRKEHEYEGVYLETTR